jgi:hypothetical protein
VRAPDPLPPEAPWLEARALELVIGLLQSHLSQFGRPLIACRSPDPRQLAQELFSASTVVLAHDGGADPRLIYANAAALRLWRRPWSAMVGMPSRLTAEPIERRARARLLSDALRQQAIRGYTGVRVDRAGRRFQIEAARLWTLPACHGAGRGQAAAFARWWWL